MLTFQPVFRVLVSAIVDLWHLFYLFMAICYARPLKVSTFSCFDTRSQLQTNEWKNPGILKKKVTNCLQKQPRKQDKRELETHYYSSGVFSANIPLEHIVENCPQRIPHKCGMSVRGMHTCIRSALFVAFKVLDKHKKMHLSKIYTRALIKKQFWEDSGSLQGRFIYSWVRSHRAKKCTFKQPLPKKSLS